MNGIQQIVAAFKGKVNITVSSLNSTLFCLREDFSCFSVLRAGLELKGFHGCFSNYISQERNHLVQTYKSSTMCGKGFLQLVEIVKTTAKGRTPE